MRRAAVLVCLALASSACTSRGPTSLTQRELKVRGTHTFDAPFDEVYDAAYLTLERYEGRIASASRLEGVVENDKVELTAPAGFPGTAYRSYAVSVFQEGGRVSVSAIPRLWADDRDVSDEPYWVLAGHNGEDEHWERLFDGIQELLLTWRDVPELVIDKKLGTVTALNVRLTTPADWPLLQLAPDRRTAWAQNTAPGALKPTVVVEVARRQPPPDATHLELTALEYALGPKLTTPEAWDTTETPTGKHGAGQVIVGDLNKTVSVNWKVWDAREPAWMIRAAAACGPADSVAGCEAQWSSMIDGVTIAPR